MSRQKVIDIGRVDWAVAGNRGVSATIGNFRIIYDDSVIFSCYSLEQPWLSNAPFESCIPVGLYEVKLGMFHTGGYESYEILTPDSPRSGIKIHIGNTIKDVLGCILVGDAVTRYSNGMLGVLASEDTFNKFMQVMGGDKKAWVSIRNE